MGSLQPPTKKQKRCWDELLHASTADDKMVFEQIAVDRALGKRLRSCVPAVEAVRTSPGSGPETN